MKKIFFLVLCLSCAFVAQAGPFYVGTSHLDNLLKSVEEPILDNAEPPAPLAEYPKLPGVDASGIEDGCPEDGTWEKIGGFAWTGDIEITDYKSDQGVAPNGTNNYRALTSIDWSPAIYSYTQKSDVDIVWEQPAYEVFETVIEGTGTEVEQARKAIRSTLERHELRFLTSLNLAGNQFRSISINGNDLMEITSIDLSNNPTLAFLELKNLPLLATLDVTGCPSVVLNIENCPDVVVTGATGIIQTPVQNTSVWADQGQLFIKGAPNEAVSVYTLDGRLVRQQKLTAGISNIALANSVYIVRLSNGTAQKVIVK